MVELFLDGTMSNPSQARPRLRSRCNALTKCVGHSKPLGRDTMARTQLFGMLKQCAAMAWSAERAGITTDLQMERLWAMQPLQRRDIFRASLRMAMTTAVSLAGCGSARTNNVSRMGTKMCIAIVGAGLAGLHCAYRLLQAGVVAHVYEASNRVGGRICTARGVFANGQ